MMMHSASITSGIRPRMRSLLLVSHTHNPRACPLPLPLRPCPSPLLQIPSNSICASRPLVSCRSYAAATPIEHPLPPPSGEIHVILGPMFAGKTTALIQRVQLEINQGKSVALIKSDKDTRYGLDSIVSHDGVQMPCWALPDLSGFPAKLGAQAYRKLDVIGIDEAQFFGDLYEFCKNAADHDGKTVIVAGLDGDYLRRSFGSVLDLIPLADSVTKLTAQCELCGGRAFFTLRKTKETQTELIGGADVYMPVCRQHYISGQIVVEAARIVLEAQKIKV